jgi:hypothetical protein
METLDEVQEFNKIGKHSRDMTREHAFFGEIQWEYRKDSWIGYIKTAIPRPTIRHHPAIATPKKIEKLKTWNDSYLLGGELPTARKWVSSPQ